MEFIVERERLDDPFEPEMVLVQSTGMAQWLQMSLSRKFGIAANIDFPLPASFIWEMFVRVLPDIPEQSAFNKQAMSWKLMALLPEMLQHDEFAMLRHYLNDDTDKRKLFQLASRTADLYDQYLVYRADWLIRWEAGELVEGLPEAQIWQAPLWKALVEPAYFQGNVDYYLKNRGQSVVTDDDGNPIDFNPVNGDPYEQPTTIKRSDGSVLYDPAFRDANPDQVRALAAEACPTFNSVHMEGFDSLSPKQEEAFDKFIQYAQNQGTTVILALSPWHPYLYDFLLTETDQHQGFFETENWIRQYAHDYNIPLYGSYDPTCIKGLDETDFFDGLHCKGCGIAKFFPGVPQVLQDVENNTLPDPLSVTPRTTLPVDGEENVENVG